MATRPQNILNWNGSTSGLTRRSILAQGKIPKRQALGLAVSGGLLAVSGLGMLAFRHFIPSHDPFSAYPTPIWPWLLALHVFPAPFFFFFAGSIWWRHALFHWRNRSRRSSGIAVVSSLGVMAGSGYLLYFVGAESWLEVCRLFHAASGSVGIALYVHHAVMGARALARARADEANGS